MSGDTEARAETLRRLQSWYQITGNPLYAWEAMWRCLAADRPPTIPDWCLPYLREAARNIFLLSRRKDFREPQSSAGDLSKEQAIKLISQALVLTRQGKRNAFGDLSEDRDDARDARSAELYGKSALVDISKRRRVTPERAQRRIARGSKLLRRPR